MYITSDTSRVVISPLDSQVDYVDNYYVGYKINGLMASGPELLLPTMSPPLVVNAGVVFRVWYGQDLKNDAEDNNRGHVYINVMVLARV